MSESLNFKVTLSGTFWNKRPQFSIWLDEQVVVQSEIPDDKPHPFVFTHTVNEGAHTLKIRLENKDPSDVVKDNPDSEDYTIVKDMLLNIEDIEIDEVSLGQLIRKTEFVLDEPVVYQGQTIAKMEGCVNLGSNGTYILNFSSPYYIWLLESI